MPLPSIGNRKHLYRRYLQYADYDRVRHSKHMLRWLSTVSMQFAGTSVVTRFGVDTSTPGATFFTLPSHGFSTGDGPYFIVLNNTYVAASLTLTVASQPSAGDTISVSDPLGATGGFEFIANGGTPVGQQIEIGTNAAGTAANARTALNTLFNIATTGSGTSIVISAVNLGSGGNNIAVDSSNDTAITGDGNLSGGADPYITDPLELNTRYWINRVIDQNSFTLRATAEGGGSTPDITPNNAGSGQDGLTLGATSEEIFNFLRTNTARVIALEDDIDDLVK